LPTFLPLILSSLEVTAVPTADGGVFADSHSDNGLAGRRRPGEQVTAGVAESHNGAPLELIVAWVAPLIDF
jgi:hypothetical protein